MGDGFHPVGKVVVLVGEDEGLASHRCVLREIGNPGCSGQGIEAGFRCIGGFELQHVAVGHILDDVVGIPGSFDDVVVVAHEPGDQVLGVLAVGVEQLQTGGFQSPDGHVGDPGMSVFFHLSPLASMISFFIGFIDYDVHDIHLSHLINCLVH